MSFQQTLELVRNEHKNAISYYFITGEIPFGNTGKFYCPNCEKTFFADNQKIWGVFSIDFMVVSDIIQEKK